jgi:hypothetical protein
LKDDILYSPKSNVLAGGWKRLSIKGEDVSDTRKISCAILILFSEIRIKGCSWGIEKNRSTVSAGC